MSTTELDQKYETILIEAYERGKQQGWHDKLQGYENPTPLSGEWAGESPNEILGDLIREATMLSAEAQGLGESGMDSAEGATDCAWQDICDNYETGYFDGNCD
jgi:hypothetical protein